MMKHYLLYLLMGLVVLPACGQGVMDYYRVPQNSQQYKRLLNRYGGPQVRDRWYVAFDGFIKTDRAQLDNTHNGLMESKSVAKPGWGITLGWSHREQWTVEGGYTRLPIHTQLAITNSTMPLSARFSNDRQAFILRGKRLVLSTSKPWLRSGFWLSGGMWVMPGGSQQEERYTLNGFRYPRQWEGHETYRLSSLTTTHAQPAALAELGAEYTIRLSNAFDIGLSARKYWGLTNAVTTDVTYTANRAEPLQAQLQGAGSGMSYGISLRYSFSIQRNQVKVLNIQGRNRPAL